jgi:hypothetical protein
MTGNFPFMLSPVQAFLGLFSRIKIIKRDACRGSVHRIRLTEALWPAAASPGQ